MVQIQRRIFGAGDETAGDAESRRLPAGRGAVHRAQLWFTTVSQQIQPVLEFFPIDPREKTIGVETCGRDQIPGEIDEDDQQAGEGRASDKGRVLLEEISDLGDDVDKNEWSDIDRDQHHHLSIDSRTSSTEVGETRRRLNRLRGRGIDRTH